MSAMHPRSLFSRAQPTPHGYRELSAAELEAARGAVRVIDVREADEFTGELGHIPGAELLPLERVREACAAWDREAELVIVCRSGRRSASMAIQLVQLGFRRVMNLTGGTLAHVAAGLAVER